MTKTSQKQVVNYENGSQVQASRDAENFLIYCIYSLNILFYLSIHLLSQDTLKQTPTTCPSCSSSLAVTSLVCVQCDTEVSGHFELTALLQLSRDDQAFVEAFVRESGSLKAMAKRLGVSYPTVRNRLDEIIDRLEASE